MARLAPGTLEATVPFLLLTCWIATLMPRSAMADQLSFDESSAPVRFSEASPLREAYAAQGVHFASPSSLDGGAILSDASDYGVKGYSQPNFLAFHDSLEARMANGGIPRAPELLSFDALVSQLYFKVGTGTRWSGTVTATALDVDGKHLSSVVKELGAQLVTITLTGGTIRQVRIETTAEAFVLDDLAWELTPDSDGDGILDPYDCAPLDPLRFPGAEELCDGVDQDCDGQKDEGFSDLDLDGSADCVDSDDDGDGVPDALDCDPNDPDRYPGAVERCDGVDQDCDGDVLEDFADSDGDLSPDCADKDDDNDGSLDIYDCAPTDPTRHPGATEICDGVDDNCDGLADSDYPDTDQDGQPDCVDPDDDNDGSPDGLDCKPLDATVFPDQFEDCDGIDNNCDGVIDPPAACGTATPMPETPTPSPTPKQGEVPPTPDAAGGCQCGTRGPGMGGPAKTGGMLLWLSLGLGLAFSRRWACSSRG